MKSSSPQRVAVVGGGIFGVSTALHLARGGAEAWLITEGAFADGASGRSLSWLNSARLRSAHYHQLRMIGIDRYRTLAAGRPDAAWLRFNGGLTWDADDEFNAIASVFVHERNIGYDARLLEPERVAAATPGVDARAITPQGAIFNPGEGWVDLPALIGVLLEEFTALGGRAAASKGPAAVETKNGRASGVALADGERIAADAIVLAVGAAAPKTLAQFGARIPTSTPISLLLRTEALRHPLRAVLNTPRVAIRPEPGGGFVLDLPGPKRKCASATTEPTRSRTTRSEDCSRRLPACSKAIRNWRSRAMASARNRFPATATLCSASSTKRQASMSLSATAAPPSASSQETCSPTRSSLAARIPCSCRFGRDDLTSKASLTLWSPPRCKIFPRRPRSLPRLRRHRLG